MTITRRPVAARLEVTIERQLPQVHIVDARSFGSTTKLLGSQLPDDGRRVGYLPTGELPPPCD
ncbi:hypothetical protein ACFYSJ_30825 [Streptomyces sp. NPDC005248]|uniref:hypothetical protein n=1 Tax=unclassified Streptomyces TaxID=2593676 RepID=UPI0033A69225